MKKVLITGANKGIGLEMARQLAKKDWFVFIGSRNMERGVEAVKTLNTEGITTVEAIQLDVTSQASVEAARMAIGRKTDVLYPSGEIAGYISGRGDASVFFQ